MRMMEMIWVSLDEIESGGFYGERERERET